MLLMKIDGYSMCPGQPAGAGNGENGEKAKENG